MLGFCPAGILWNEHADEEDVAANNKDGANVGYTPVNMIVETYENAESILTSCPTGVLKPQPFIEGSRAKIEKTAASVISKFGAEMEGVVQSWRSFLAEAPENDNVWDYIGKILLYILYNFITILLL